MTNLQSHLVTLIALLIPSLGFAQDAETDTQARFDHHVDALSNAFEAGVSTGYSQGGGPIGGAMAHLEDVAGAGASLELQAAYRISPIFAVGAYGSLSTYDTGKASGGNDVFASGAGLMATAHLRPERSIDPFVSVSGGWKALYIDPPGGTTTVYQGFDLARLQIGVDYRVSKDVAIAPVIGGSLGMYVSEKSEMTSGYEEIADKKVNLTGFAGVSARFGVGL